MYNITLFQIPQRYRFSSKSQRMDMALGKMLCCFRYHKGTDFQANHNCIRLRVNASCVVLDTTKVQIFKQITTIVFILTPTILLFQIPQRYRFSSKSQRLCLTVLILSRCFRYHKGTDFQANHNQTAYIIFLVRVVLDTTKVQIFKQITTTACIVVNIQGLFQIPQRYRFSSKSQQTC